MVSTFGVINSCCGVGGDTPGPGPGDALPVEEALESGRIAGLSGGCRRRMDVDAFEVDRDGGQGVLVVGLGFCFGSGTGACRGR